MHSDSMSPTPADLALLRHWTDAHFAAPETLPFSFIYGGERIRGIPGAWHPTLTRRRIDAALVETVYEGADPATGLRIRAEALAYSDYPVREWTVWLTATGDAPTLLIEDLQALDAPFNAASPLLWSCNGDFYNEAGYTPTETPLAPGAELSFAPHGGRPSDSAFPYFRLAFAGCGLSLAVGWPAQWEARFRLDEDGVRIRAGQQTTALRLRPGETIRTPRIALMAWTGDSTRAANLWRRWYRQHVLPHPQGGPLEPGLFMVGTDTGEEFTAATEENQIRYAARAREKGFDFDYWWIDAGWYPCADAAGKRHWPLTGTWHPDPERFPRGLRPISDALKAQGARLLVWFEPERVSPGSRLDTEHPEWLLKLKDHPEGWRLLNLGLPECRRWLTDHVAALIQESGIGVYRQDFNFEPLPYWREADAPDRQGMAENLHVQGYLAYWDELLARNPGLWIDSCSSGGRRNDLETMRRAVPLHHTDYGYGIHPVKLAFHHTLYAWIPYFKDFSVGWDQLAPEEDRRFDREVDRFSYHCGLAPAFMPTLDIRRDDYDYPQAVALTQLWRKVAGTLLHGDYYPLTPFSRSGERWVVWQFHQPERGAGLIQALRHAGNAEERFTVRLCGLDPAATYLLEDAEGSAQQEMTGAALMEGKLELGLPPRGAALLLYRRV